MAEIRLVKLRKDFKGITAVEDVTITFRSSAVTCLLGPSGCGKTTMMRIIAGLERPTSGDVFFDDDRVTDLVTRKRQIGMVFQYPVVYAGITARQNIELPLLHEGLSPAERAQRVDEVADRPLVHPGHAFEHVRSACECEHRGQRPECGAGIAEE
jgi:ABC-type sugar transport system ATPase subunit